MGRKDSFTVRSWPWNGVLGAGLLLVAIGLVPGALTDSVATVRAVFACGAVVCLVLAFRASRRGVAATAEGVRVVGVLKSRHLPWASIREIRCQYAAGGVLPAVVPVIHLESANVDSSSANAEELSMLASYTFGRSVSRTFAYRAAIQLDQMAQKYRKS